MVEKFVEYLLSQEGQAYVWGGQHTKLTPSTYESVIDKKESKCTEKTDSNGNLYTDLAKEYCKEKFDAGTEVLYGYDCSGLGMYWLQNVMGLLKSDTNANGLMKKCTLSDEAPKAGWWVFRTSNGRASHIGYMVSDTELVEAKGRAYGVAKTPFKASSWHCWGIPDLFASELKTPVATPQETEYRVRIKGGSVHVRDTGSTKGRKLGTARKGETYPLLGEADTGWYEILYKGQTGYISNKPKYTEVI